ncbi:protein NLRC3 isoform X1 [Nothobranchius furzeri]|nr:transcript variant X1 [Nothobranchius furzeri]
MRKRSAPPEPDGVSMWLGQLIRPPVGFRDEDHIVYKPHLEDEKQNPPISLTNKRAKSLSVHFNVYSEESIHQQRPGEQQPGDPRPTCVSLRTERSKNEPIQFKDGNLPEDEIADPTSAHPNQTGSGEQIPGDHEEYSKQLDSAFKELKEEVNTFTEKELERLRNILSLEDSGRLQEDHEETNEEKEQMNIKRDFFLKFTMTFLSKWKPEWLSDILQKKTHVMIYQLKFKSHLMKKCKSVCETTTKATFVDQIYTELYVTEHGRREANGQHELQQIGAASWIPESSKSTISCDDIFKRREGEPGWTLMTKGVAGIGKTVLTHKYTLDWVEEKANHNIQFIFPFTFRELNLLKGKTYSLVELIHYVFTDIKEAGICRFEEFQVVFIFDGLDECRPPLDFNETQILTDVTESAPVDVLIINLIRRKLLPSAHLWITTRPAAANQIPPEFVDMVTEVRGFKDPQKEEYFKKRFTDEEHADRIVSHIGTSRSLHIMCHIPVFCCITATVLDHVLKNSENKELPKTLTELYIHFLLVQAKRDKEKYLTHLPAGPIWNEETKKMFRSLGKLAFKQLEKGNLMFYEEDLKEFNMNINTASMYSGMFTEIFKEECGLNQERVFSFVHLSIQEFLAALYVFLKFNNTGVNVLKGRSVSVLSEAKTKQFYLSAVDKALESPNGHLDMFVRFLLGLSLKTNQRLLKGLVSKTRRKPQATETLVQYVKKKVNNCSSTERSIRMFHWLNELNDRSLEEEIQQSLSESDFAKKLTASQWRALAFILLSSQRQLETFDLKKFCASKEALKWLQPVVKASKISLLSGCNLSWRSCISVVDILTCKNSHLRELDLSNNDLRDAGVKLLSQGLKNPMCRLEVLSLSGCLVTQEGCDSLATALSFNPSHLRELDLSFNHPGESGLHHLFAGLQEQKWKLKALKYSQINNTVSLFNACVDALVRFLLSIHRTDHCGKSRLSPSPQRFFCELTLDLRTANENLQVSQNLKYAIVMKEKQSYPDQPERFVKWKQLLCGDGFTGRCYWEVKWKGSVRIGVTYKTIKRKGKGDNICIGKNDHSWSLFCTQQGFTAWHKNTALDVEMPQNTESNRIAVYLDWSAGTLSFYCLPKLVSSIQKIHLHTFQATFTEPLYPVFGFGHFYKFKKDSTLLYSSVYLTQVD